MQDISAYNSDKSIDKLPFPIIADSKRELSVQLGMLDPDEIDKDGMPLTARVVNTHCLFNIAFLQAAVFSVAYVPFIALFLFNLLLFNQMRTCGPSGLPM